MPVRLVREYEPALGSVQIGLINNMPDAALKATERQFLTLLDAAADRVVVNVSLYALPGIPRSESAKCHLQNFYSGVEDLWDRYLDGLIVTGTEPRVENLRDEPYWESLAKVIEWAEENTRSTVFSCLAAHSALLHRDGIGRRRLARKRFGVFECLRAAQHSLTAGIRAPLQMPHSRWNDVAESELTDCGYRILTRASDGGVDSFTKQRKSLSVYFQGHPEYDANTLLLEYRRDVRRYLRGEIGVYPALPESYFDQRTTDIFAALRERALADRRPELLADFPIVAVGQSILHTWQSASALVYGNWMACMSAQKQRHANGTLRRTYIQRATGATLALPLPVAEAQ
jgi:homoserine O-succinyltransferase